MRWLLHYIRALLLIGTPLHAGIAQPVWLVPRTGPDGAADFMDLFHPDAAWRRAAAAVQAVEVGAGKFYSDAELMAMATDLRRRGMAFVMGMLPLSADWTKCGVDVEGYSSEGQSAAGAQELKALGIAVDYYAMDGPLWYGHAYDGRNACHASIADLAVDVASKVKQVQAIFPNARFGDVEPVGVPTKDWSTDLDQWFDAYRTAVGEELAFFRADIQWDRPEQWQPQINQISRMLRKRGISLQIIYNGGDAHSDAEWIAQANRHFRQFESSGRSPPDVAVFQSWVQYPARLLPESDPRTMTALINQYIDWRRTHP